MARIIEIIALGSASGPDDGASGANVSESLGYVTNASGTENDDTLTLSGRAIYNVESGGGNDKVMIKSGTISRLSTGDGADKIQAAGAFIGDVDAGAGDDAIELKAGLALDVSGGDGKDNIKISANTMRGIDGGAGNDTMYLEGHRIFASGGTGNDDVTIHQTGKGDDGVVEYTFGKGDGQDTIATDGPISLRLGHYTASDVTISVKDNLLTATFKGSDDKISVTLDPKALTGKGLTYSFGLDKGQTVLKIG